MFAAIGLGGPAARAGEVYSTPLCANASEVIDYFATASFTGNPKCESLCKKTYSDCKEYLARSKSCEKASAGDNNYYFKKVVCDVLADPAARKECKQLSDSGTASAKDAINAEDQSARDQCAAIRDNCIATCTL